jgi:hypothetical protein
LFEIEKINSVKELLKVLIEMDKLGLILMNDSKVNKIMMKKIREFYKKEQL